MTFASDRRHLQTSRRQSRRAARAFARFPIEELETRRLLAAAIPVAQTYVSTDPPTAIVGGSLRAANIDIANADPMVLTDITVNVNIHHPNDANLTLTLESPSGTYVTLTDQSGSTNNFSNTTFDDLGTRSTFAPAAHFTGIYRPQQQLGRLDGETINGRWRLLVDDHQFGESGTIDSFSLTITGSTTATASAGSASIPDNDTLSQVLTISDPGLVADARLQISLEHPVDGELSAALVSPTGTQITLFDSLSGVDVTNLILDDHAANVLQVGQAPYTGTFQPQEPFSSFLGELANGDWTLVITDTSAGNTGQLISAQLTLATVPGTGQIRGSVWADTNKDGQRAGVLPSAPLPDTIFTVDRSNASTAVMSGVSVGDVNQDGINNSILDAELAGYIALNQKLIASGKGATRIAIDVYGDTASMLDMDPVTAGVQLVTTADSDLNANGTPDVEEILASLASEVQANHYSDYAGALQNALDTFNTISTTNNNGQLIFLSASVPTAPGKVLYADKIAELKAKNVFIRAYGLGTGAAPFTMADFSRLATVVYTNEETMSLITSGGGLISGGHPDSVFVVDISASSGSPAVLPLSGTSVGDVNQDGDDDSALDSELAGFIALDQFLIDSGQVDARIMIETYGDLASVLDMDPVTPGVQNFTTAGADLNQNGTPDVQEVLMSIVAQTQFDVDGDADWAGALTNAVDWFNQMQTAPFNGNVIFMATGGPHQDPNIPPQDPTTLFEQQLADLQSKGVYVHAVAVDATRVFPPPVPVIDPLDATSLSVIDPNLVDLTDNDTLIDMFSKNGLTAFSEDTVAGATMYLDLNDNGVLDTDEPTAVTDQDGNYRFVNLPAGTYSVREVLPANTTLSLPVGGAASITLNAGQIARNVTFGNAVAQGIVSGGVFNDLNGNGIRETDLVSGVSPDVVFVVDASPASLFLMPGATVGDVNGDGVPNTILDVEIASYIELLQGLIARGMGFTSNMNVVAFADSAKFVDLSSPTGDVQRHLHPATDANNNGAPDVQELLLSIDPTRMLFGEGSDYKSALSLANQAFTAMGTTQGNGRIVFMTARPAQAGNDYTAELASLNARGVTSRAFAMNLPGFQGIKDIDPTVDLNVVPGRGSFMTAEAAINAFAGVADQLNVVYSEPGMAGVTVYADANNNGSLDVGEASTVTDANGLYSFAGLAAGSYTLRQELPNGYIAISPSTGTRSLTLVTDQSAPGQSFANGVPAAGVGGSVWNDLNRNGQYDFEPLLQGVTVYLDLNDNGALDDGEPSAVTDGNGYWEIDNIAAGTYTIREILPPGFLDGTPATGSYQTTLVSGASLNDSFDFAIQQPVPLVPHMDVKGVPDGSLPSSASHTDFGKVAIGSAKGNKFVIRSTGNTDLKLNGHPLISISGKGKKQFRVTQVPAARLYPGQTAAFKLVFKPTAAGKYTAVIRIPSNDPDTNPYTFVIRGVATARKGRTARRIAAAPSARPAGSNDQAAWVSGSTLLFSTRSILEATGGVLD